MDRLSDDSEDQESKIVPIIIHLLERLLKISAGPDVSQENGREDPIDAQLQGKGHQFPGQGQGKPIPTARKTVQIPIQVIRIREEGPIFIPRKLSRDVVPREKARLKIRQFQHSRQQTDAQQVLTGVA